ncbi:MAG: thioredoxin-disulfide reductase [Rickettsiales bacterium]|jgi:thioredoxin reductase (NADPH)|nr:thioredoxin-disulfide reductase [Rickettsiales bacterium]
MQSRKIAIIGSGPAGWSAAIYAARGGMKPLVITGLEFGGQITKTNVLENYPGFSSQIDGVFLTEEMRKQAEAFGAEILADSVVSVDLSARPFVLRCDGGEEVEAEALIIATGTAPRALGMPNESALVGHGVSYCATCDGFFFKGKDVVVVGGGNAAIYEALHLAGVARRVYLVHRREEFRAESVNVARLRSMKNVEFALAYEVAEILENGGAVSGVRLARVGGGESREIAASAVFVSIGHNPNTALFSGQIELDAGGYVAVKPGLCATSAEGVFAAGDVKSPRFRQVVIAAASGAQAAMEALELLN